jgi:hypothetical protein
VDGLVLDTSTNLGPMWHTPLRRMTAALVLKALTNYGGISNVFFDKPFDEHRMMPEDNRFQFHNSTRQQYHACLFTHYHFAFMAFCSFYGAQTCIFEAFDSNTQHQ